jgi:hypothetical protein
VIEVRVVGVKPDSGGDLHEAVAILYAVPRVGDCLSVWTGTAENYVTVEMVSWPTWRYAHLDDDHQEPTVQLRRDDSTDEEWGDVFAAISEGRAP